MRDNESLLLGEFKDSRAVVIGECAEFRRRTILAGTDAPLWRSDQNSRLGLFLVRCSVFACNDRPEKDEPNAALWALNSSVIEEMTKNVATGLIADFKPPLDLSGISHFEKLAWYVFDKANEAIGMLREEIPR